MCTSIKGTRNRKTKEKYNAEKVTAAQIHQSPNKTHANTNVQIYTIFSIPSHTFCVNMGRLFGNCARA
jgi:NADP-dependent 3-hydroxy acid dehydrogenase YdfG